MLQSGGEAFQGALGHVKTQLSWETPPVQISPDPQALNNRVISSPKLRPMPFNAVRAMGGCKVVNILVIISRAPGGGHTAPFGIKLDEDETMKNPTIHRKPVAYGSALLLIGAICIAPPLP